MKFSHIADVHLGNWRDPKLKELGALGFIKSIDESINYGVDFILIAGDLFHTALPGIDYVKLVVKKLREVKDKGIRLYYIAGSHDYSPSGKTMLDIIEEADLGINVMKGFVKDDKLSLKFTVDESGAKITGLIGRAGMLEKKYYEKLNRELLESEEGFKIFMFHTALDELKPTHLADMESSPISFLPKGFDYYAGGHVHIIKRFEDEDYKNVIYPGPVFPGNFSELEKLRRGGFYIYDEGEIIRKDIEIKKVVYKEFDFENKTVEEINSLLELEEEVNDCIVLIRAKGTIKGRVSNIDFKEFINQLYEEGAYHVLKNTSKLRSEEFKEIKIKASSLELETKLIKEHLGQIKNNFKSEEEATKQLIHSLSQEKNEGEKAKDYESRIKKESLQLLEGLKDDI
ncbi:MAG: metallophosphoesterase [Candidatus Woesearchaeota archaeon]